MTDERCKQLMEQVGMPNSRSLMVALKQVANETEQEVRAECNKLPLKRFEVYQKLGCPINETEGAETQGYREIVDTVYDLLEQHLKN